MGASDVYEYFKKDVFSNPKPVELIKFLCGFGLCENDIILDFLVVQELQLKQLCVMQ